MNGAYPKESAWPSILPGSRLRAESGLYRCGRFNTISDKALVDVERSLILGQVPGLVSLRQDAPDAGLETERLRQHLEDDVAVLRPVAEAPQGCQRQRMSGVVDQIEAAL